VRWFRRLFGSERHEHRAGPKAARDGALVGGVKQGRWIEDEEHGTRLLEVEYRDGVRDGAYRRWRHDRTLLEEGVYVAGKREGAFVIHGRKVRIDGNYHADELDGIHRATRPDGSIESEREYRDGVLVRGPWELRDDVHRNWIRERGTYADGLREGLWQEYGIPRAGAPKGELGPLIVRCEYQRGMLDGRYQSWTYHDNMILKDGAYAAGRRVGHWRFTRHDGSTSAEVDYDDAGAVRSLRWTARDGRDRPPVAVLGGDDVERWIALADEWDARQEGGVSGVQLAVDRWPAHDRARALAWIDERLAAGERPDRWFAIDEWFELMTDRDDIDPRTRLVDSLSFDHRGLNAAQTDRLLRFAPQIVVLAFTECVVEPGLEALFPEGVAWSRLEALSFDECGPPGAVIRLLASASWAVNLRDLGFTYDALSTDDVTALLGAPWLDQLTDLSLSIDERAGFEAIAARGMAQLRRLELEASSGEEPLTPEIVAALIDPGRRPHLERLSLTGVQITGELPHRDGVEVVIEE
jgi:antitoxin component YwqK of YwqJK toxin-antitoxin module